MNYLNIDRNRYNNSIYRMYTDGILLLHVLFTIVFVACTTVLTTSDVSVARVHFARAIITSTCGAK